VGDDPERAPRRGDDARAGAAGYPGRERVEDADAGGGDDDQRGEEELEGQRVLREGRDIGSG
jgi:hypothetical protein